VTGANGSEASRQTVLRELRDGERFLLGSLVAMHGVLSALGKHSVMLISEDDLPLPYEYAWLDYEGAVAEVPEDIDSRTVVFLDCGNVDRNPVKHVRSSHILNLDHHHDNTCFGTVNHVVPEASCTAEIVWDLMAGLRVTPTLRVAEALYVGLVTDTGRFMYENTGPRAHLMAAELIAAGVDVHETYRRLYEGMPEPKLVLLARALSGVRRYDEGRLTFGRLERRDFDETGAAESYTEGIIDHLRAVGGTKVAALMREGVSEPGEPPRAKVSLRATDGDVDVSAIARQGGGGGHRQAAGFTTELSPTEVVEFLREQIAEQLAPAAS
jgi:bifunctional oligoribonuclease and PAP phosphatase NrnA